MAGFKGERHKLFLNRFAVIINSAGRKSFNNLFLAGNIVLKIYKLLNLFGGEIFLHRNFCRSGFLNRGCFLSGNFLRWRFLGSNFLRWRSFLRWRFFSYSLFRRCRFFSGGFFRLYLVFERTKYSHNYPLVFSNHLRNFCFELLEAMAILYSRLGRSRRQLPQIQAKSHRVRTPMRLLSTAQPAAPTRQPQPGVEAGRGDRYQLRPQRLEF